MSLTTGEQGSPLMSRETSLRHQLFGAWCAPIFTVLTIIGWLWLAHFWLPAAADLSAADTAAFFKQHHDGIVLGCSIFSIGCMFLVLSSVQLGVMLWEIEGSPLWSIAEILSGTAIALIVFLNCCMWIGATYRPEAMNPDIVAALNDTAWLGFLLGWCWLSLQMVATAVVALNDPRSTPLFPRWLSWASILGAVALMTAGGPAFTRSGPFAYHGVLGFYLPVVIWGSWLDGHAWYMRKAVLRRREAGTDAIAHARAA